MIRFLIVSIKDGQHSQCQFGGTVLENMKERKKERSGAISLCLTWLMLNHLST